MDWLQFVSSIFGSVVWPAASITILILFKREIAAHLPMLKTLKLPGGIEAVFNQELLTVVAAVERSEAEKQAQPVSPAMEAGNVASRVGEVKHTFDVRSFIHAEDDPAALKANPTGVVMESWKGLESFLRTAANRARRFSQVSGTMDFAGTLEYLSEVDFLVQDEVENIAKLKRMRDLAAHSNDSISADSANAFSVIAKQLVETLTHRMYRKFP